MRGIQFDANTSIDYYGIAIHNRKVSLTRDEAASSVELKGHRKLPVGMAKLGNPMTKNGKKVERRPFKKENPDEKFSRCGQLSVDTKKALSPFDNRPRGLRGTRIL